MQLSDDFISYTRTLFGEVRFERFMKALDEESPVSIRLNPLKSGTLKVEGGEPVPWCRNGYYLPTRPNFTFDPLLHAGCYYVQEASSMFLDEVLRQHMPSHPTIALDLCAAPGGKSTLLRAALPAETVLYSNEPIRKRASVLLENVEKWGFDNHIVTNSYPKDYRRSKMTFDVILCDVPCSGEGMFRKDEASVKEWSTQNVEHCQELQREIVSNAWQCLNEEGLFIYSTCTYNTKEDEENVRWMMEELGAEVLPVEIKDEWGITGSLLKDFTEPVYRFIPGYTKGEGLFMAVMRKSHSPLDRRRLERQEPLWQGDVNSQIPSLDSPKQKGKKEKTRRFSLKENNSVNKDIAILTPLLSRGEGPEVSLSYPQAIAYLRGEALTLPPATPKGMVTVSFEGFPLGAVKNIGSRANNLYPKEWRIKSTYLPKNYEAILRLT